MRLQGNTDGSWAGELTGRKKKRRTFSCTGFFLKNY